MSTGETEQLGQLFDRQRARQLYCLCSSVTKCSRPLVPRFIQSSDAFIARATSFEGFVQAIALPHRALSADRRVFESSQLSPAQLRSAIQRPFLSAACQHSTPAEVRATSGLLPVGSTSTAPSGARTTRTQLTLTARGAAGDAGALRLWALRPVWQVILFAIRRAEEAEVVIVVHDGFQLFLDLFFHGTAAATTAGGRGAACRACSSVSRTARRRRGATAPRRDGHPVCSGDVLRGGSAGSGLRRRSGHRPAATGGGPRQSPLA